GLELGVGVRYDDYSDFGGTTNPKFTIRYTPVEQLLLRASYNTGFSAPTLFNLNLPNSTTFTANRYNDPLLCPGGVPAPGAIASRDCGIQFQQLQGGNENLTPEESNAYSLGFVLQPVPSFNFSVDYWHYKIRDSIGVIGEQTIFGDPVQYANLFVRCSQANATQRLLIGACQNPGAVDPLAFITNTFQNLGETETDGFDFSANWQGPATRFGRFNVGFRGTYVRNYDFQVVKGGQFFDPVGNYSPQFAGPVIRLQTVTTLGWNQNAWGAFLTHRFLSGYTDQNAVPAPFNQNRVQDYSIFDLTGTFTGFRGITLKAGVLNVFDEDPPFTNQVGRFQARGYDDRFHNPLGRVFVVGASYQF
ncbi:MAG: TonB-dependent receptor domain-containing protein, partial [Burkholderiaceae bacterium]